MKKFWNEQRSIRLSRAFILLFGALVISLDLIGPRFIKFICANILFHTEAQFELPLLITLYACSIPAYITLYSLYHLLQNIEMDQVFIEHNVILMRRVSWCCCMVSLICLLAAHAWISLLVVSLAAALMALIVRIVKNVFVRAIHMKDELDLTI